MDALDNYCVTVDFLGTWFDCTHAWMAHSYFTDRGRDSFDSQTFEENLLKD